MFYILCSLIHGYAHDAQSYTPQLVIKPLGQDPPNKFTGALWGFLIVPVTIYLGAFIQRSPMFDEGSGDQEGQLAVMISGIAAFAIVFAINSSVHSYLVVRYADGDKVSQVRESTQRERRGETHGGTRVESAKNTILGSCFSDGVREQAVNGRRRDSSNCESQGFVSRMLLWLRFRTSLSQSSIPRRVVAGPF